MVKKKRTWTPEQKEAASERMKNHNKERAAKKAVEPESAKALEEESPIPTSTPSTEVQAGINKEQTDKKDMSWLEDRVTIILHEMEGLPSHQFVAINGYPFTIKVGEEVTVPRAVLGVLNDAVINTKEYIPIPGQPGAFTVNKKVIRRFAISSKA